MPLNYALQQTTKVISGAGCIANIAELLNDAGYKKPFLICDPGIKATGVIEKIQNILCEAQMESVLFDRVQPDPPDDIVEEAADICKSNECDCVVAIGGGSSIDTGHGVTVLRFNPGHILDYANPENQMVYCPGLISVPTTAGTGAELSNGIIISNHVTGEKVPIVGYMAMSEYAILDPEMTVGMPKGLTAMTGLDAFAHAMEAYTTVLNSAIISPVCEKVMENVVANLPIVMENPTDIKARETMLMSASLGGWCLANCCAHVGHSLAHVLGGAFHMPHGAAVAYGAPATIKHIAPAVPEKVKKIGEILGVAFDGTETPEQIGEKTAAAYINFRDVVLGFKPVAEWGIDKNAAVALAPKIVAETFAPLTPQPVTEEKAAAILAEIFG